MDVLSWNCHGIGLDSKLFALKGLISKTRPSIPFLSETKIHDMDDFYRLARGLSDFGFSHSEEVLSEGRFGGLGLFWGDNVKVRVCLKSAIRELSDQYVLPWALVGDFNEILHAGEKQDGQRRRESQMRGFREVVDYANLIDLGFVRTKFTWSNKHTKIRLDCALVTATWSDIFPHSKVNILPPSLSDHSPIVLQISTRSIVQKNNVHCFRFESFWLQHPECDQVVQSEWQSPFGGLPMFNVSQKIKSTCFSLDLWQRTTFRDRQERILEVRNHLAIILDSPLSSSLAEENESLILRLQQLTSEHDIHTFLWRNIHTAPFLGMILWALFLGIIISAPYLHAAPFLGIVIWAPFSGITYTRPLFWA
ncbi:hypothetical protein M0R45_006828 [Rubus argutus]|uniref:Endonuclease/exonuclease/phosphatase domain-containing protein n=1 Tax=Rubus argutus TaxID=59490 RepID=A0AAW1YRL3_RUBAR